MSKMQRDKGKRGEREVAEMLSEAFGREVRRTFGQCREGHEAPDVESSPRLPWWTEVTIGKAPNPFGKWEQANEAVLKGHDMRTPVVFLRKDRGRWFVFIEATDFLSMVTGTGAGPCEK